jgi:hypothetical protein
MKLDWHTTRVDGLSYLPSMNLFGIFPEMQAVVPDFWRNDPDRDSKSKWVCECGLSSDEEIMMRKVKCMVAHEPIDLALVISISDNSKGNLEWCPPEEDADSAIALRSRPRIEYKDFYAAAACGNLLGPIVVEGVNWFGDLHFRCSIFLRGEDGNFDLDNRDPVCFAKGVCYIP